MSYCRFENTAGDLLDCQEHILEALGNDYEKFGRISLVKSCIGILEDLGCSVQNSDYEEIVVEDAEAILEKAGVNRPDPDDEEEEHEGPKTAEEVDNSLDGRGPDKEDEDTGNCRDCNFFSGGCGSYPFNRRINGPCKDFLAK